MTYATRVLPHRYNGFGGNVAQGAATKQLSLYDFCSPGEPIGPPPSVKWSQTRHFLSEAPRANHLQRLSLFVNTLGKSLTGSQLAKAFGNVSSLPQTRDQLIEKMLFHCFLTRPRYRLPLENLAARFFVAALSKPLIFESQLSRKPEKGALHRNDSVHRDGRLPRHFLDGLLFVREHRDSRVPPMFAGRRSFSSSLVSNRCGLSLLFSSAVADWLRRTRSPLSTRANKGEVRLDDRLAG
ncbi:hypothetical protein [Paraburkholderia youngii]|uniref:Uncharacterized protein n=1 Tax=Paraburkholderia youngii TaxID=2782701 RepID=A0A7W8L4G7_9BURK|nr:hypothetical protein [Paraburkholderia youngii]MBB5400296.1 hypothetical protein [Paraburkholderia youngii]